MKFKQKESIQWMKVNVVTRYGKKIYPTDYKKLSAGEQQKYIVDKWSSYKNEVDSETGEKTEVPRKNAYPITYLECIFEERYLPIFATTNPKK